MGRGRGRGGGRKVVRLEDEEEEIQRCKWTESERVLPDLGRDIS